MDFRSFDRQPVFGFLDGEAFGYLGSNRFIEEAKIECDQNSESCFDLEYAYSIVEMKQVGSIDSGNDKLSPNMRYA